MTTAGPDPGGGTGAQCPPPKNGLSIDVMLLCPSLILRGGALWLGAANIHVALRTLVTCFLGASRSQNLATSLYVGEKSFVSSVIYINCSFVLYVRKVLDILARSDNPTILL